jgi:post-segregation antitoxin (ccd killing protein)
MPKLNVYVSDALAAAIKAVGISVSPICQKALEEEVRKVNATRALATHEAAVRAAAERLDSAFERTAREPADSGAEHGRLWAFETATVHELELVGGTTRGWPTTTQLDVDPRRFPTLYPTLEKLGYPSIDGVICIFPGGLRYPDPFTTAFLRAAAEAWHAIAAEMERSAGR